MTSDGTVAKYRAATRPVPSPTEPLPPLSCDCHFHALGDPARFPQTHSHSGYGLAYAPLDDLLRVHRALGIERGVMVQPSGYGNDHTYLLHALAEAPKGRYRATALIDDSVDDRELQRLHDAGVRGSRVILFGWSEFKPGPAELDRLVDRIRAMGWYLKVFLGSESMPDYHEALKRITSVPVVLDHMCRVMAADGMDHPAFRMTLDLVRRDNVWMILSNGYHFSTQKTGWTDVAAMGRRFYDAAPDRCLWGSDWPHPRDEHEGHGPTEAEALALLNRYLPDAAARRKVLVDNPARLHGFED